MVILTFPEIEKLYPRVEVTGSPKKLKGLKLETLDLEKSILY